MSFFTEIDRRLRHSRLARAQPYIRQYAPWLHKALLVSREILLPYRSRYGLTRYQHAAIQRFYAATKTLSGSVLEIGSDSDGKVLKELSSRRIGQAIGLNVDLDFSAHIGRAIGALPDYDVVQGDVRRLPFRTDSISSIISIMAFEHIHDFDIALNEMHRALKPGGIVYSAFGPIWSSSIGHHVYAIADGLEARHWKPGKNPVPHFGHLLLTRDEMRAAVLEQRWVTPNLADAIVQWVYDGAGINRLFYEDYIAYFETSPFAVRQLTPVKEHVPRRMKERLQAQYGERDFGVRMVEVILEKRSAG